MKYVAQFPAKAQSCIYDQDGLFHPMSQAAAFPCGISEMCQVNRPCAGQVLCTGVINRRVSGPGRFPVPALTLCTAHFHLLAFPDGMTGPVHLLPRDFCWRFGVFQGLRQPAEIPRWQKRTSKSTQMNFPSRKKQGVP